ncbi:MAG: cytochrome P450 [Novosphingobium sp.]|nr:cytochrome P450 [Novosphingobium sp.]
MAIFSHTVDRPAHVPESAVYDFDYFRDEALLREPHKRALELAETAPRLFWTPHNGGHWMAAGYDIAFQVMREYESFSSQLLPAEYAAAMGEGLLPDGRRAPRMTPIMMDPPEHTRMRAPLQKTFSPKTVMALKADIEVLAEELVSAVVPLGGCDFIPTVIEQLPVRIFLRMMGLPEDRIEEYRLLVREVFAPRGEGHSDPLMRMRNIADVMLDEIRDRRDNPRDDIISMLWQLEIEGEAMSLDLMEDYCCLLFLAGLDTVINAMGHGMRHLAMNPQLQDELREKPDLIVEATEEMLRRYSVSAPIRRALHDTELGGQHIRKDDLIVMFLSIVDLDPAEFPSPGTFDLARENKNHLIFGAGPHRCLGSHLARVELQTFYRVVLETLPRFRPDPDKRPIFHAGNMIAISSLPIRWD